MTYRLSFFFYVQKQKERKINHVKIFYVRYRATRSGAIDDVVPNFIPRKSRVIVVKKEQKKKGHNIVLHLSYEKNFKYYCLR